MNNTYATEQEQFWSGDSGTEYIERNALTSEAVAAALARWGAVLSRTSPAPCSCLELGANIGINLHALHSLLPKSKLSAVEINPKAAARLREWGIPTVHETSLLDFRPESAHDFVFTSGVLIHMHPDTLQRAYSTLYTASKRHICIMEYYNPTPVEIAYRGRQNLMFKRDFAGDMLTAYPDLRLCGYGFFYSKDPVFAHDDVTWFLLEKS